MLRGFLRMLSNGRRSAIQQQTDPVVLYATIDRRIKPPTTRPVSPCGKTLAPTVRVNHRERLYSMRLEHIKICSPRRCERLCQLGIVTAGDLARADPQRLAQHFGSPRKALGVIKQYRRSIRFAAAVAGMMPRDALLLISIHRRSVRGLASESPGALYRDLERFAESTKGRNQLRGRRIPSTRRLKRWIAECQGSVAGAASQPLHVRAA